MHITGFIISEQFDIINLFIVFCRKFIEENHVSDNYRRIGLEFIAKPRPRLTHQWRKHKNKAFSAYVDILAKHHCSNLSRPCFNQNVIIKNNQWALQRLFLLVSSKSAYKWRLEMTQCHRHLCLWVKGCITEAVLSRLMPNTYRRRDSTVESSRVESRRRCVLGLIFLSTGTRSKKLTRNRDITRYR